MGRLAQSDSKFFGLNSTDGLDWARQWRPLVCNLRIRDVIVSGAKWALGQLVQILLIDSASDKILKIYIYITNPQVYGIINWLNKNFKMHFFIFGK